MTEPSPEPRAERARCLVGIGHRRPLARWIDSHPPEIECVEITAEHFFDTGDAPLRALAARYPCYVHGLGLSLGTPGPLDAETLRRFVRVAEAANAEWVSEHVAFTRSDEFDLGHLNPLRPNRETLAVVAEHAVQLREATGRPVLLENITSHLRIAGELSETEFLGRLCDEADCGLLLDVTNLYVNSRNHGFDPRPWLRDLPADRIVQLHVVGYTERDGRWEDSHAEPIQPDLRDLLHAVLEYARPRAMIVERDQRFLATAVLARELRSLAGSARLHVDRTSIPGETPR